MQQATKRSLHQVFFKTPAVAAAVAPFQRRLLAPAIPAKFIASASSERTSTASNPINEKISFKYQEFGQFIINEIGKEKVEKFTVSLTERWLVLECATESL